MTDAAWSVRDVSWPGDALAAVQRYARGRELAWLDSSTARAGQYSLLCIDPLAELVQIQGEPAAFFIAGIPRKVDASGWRLWRQVQQPLLPACPLPLGPGWVGYLGFESAGQLERLSPARACRLSLPIIRLALFDRAIVLDHERRQAFAVVAGGLRASMGASALDPREWMESWEDACLTSCREVGEWPPRVIFEMERGDFERAVQRALDYIAAGDVYQVNLAQRLRLTGGGEPLAVYARLRTHNPAPYSACLRWHDGAVASVSPELFLQLRGRDVLTRPIKGTRPRTGDPRLDAAYRQALLASEKEAAELAMIVDLHRNDLGRVCEYGSVRVMHPRRLEVHPSVFHTLADVTGKLAPGRDGLDLLAACFPAGSISGAPKIRALQIIDELEPVPRGVYTGAIGVLGLDGNLTFNVAIRTLQVRGDEALLHVGGGIVADSDPREEYDETLAKAAGILRALDCELPNAAAGSVAAVPRR